MTGLAPVDPATATGKAAELLADAQKTLGLTPNMTKVMASSPALLKGYLALNGALGGGVLPAPVRERLALATAEYNSCGYCLSAHTYIGANIAKIDAGELEAAPDATASGPHTPALLALSDAIARGHSQVDDAALQAARDAGATDAEIGEVAGHLTLNVLANYFNILTKAGNDWPVVTPRIAAWPALAPPAGPTTPDRGQADGPTPRPPAGDIASCTWKEKR